MRVRPCALLLIGFGLCTGATAQPVVDGRNGATPGADGYGAAKWVNTVPTSFGDSVAIAAGNSATVSSGVEVAIPLAAIGLNGPTYPSSIRICVLVTSPDGGYISNQFLPSLPVNTRNLGFTATRDLSNPSDPTVAGLQYMDLTLVATSSPPTTFDGLRDEPGGANPYGSPLSVQQNFTDFGKAKHGNRGGGQGLEVNGSEIDAIYARVAPELPPQGKRGEPDVEPLVKVAGPVLHLFVAGNIEANGNKVVVFFDTVPGAGQQSLGSMPNPAYAGLTGLTFDPGFAPDYALGVTCCTADPNAAPPTFCLFADFFMDDGTGFGWITWHCGNRVFPNSGALADVTGSLTGGDIGAPPVLAAIDNSNTQGAPRAPIGPANRDVANGSEIDAVYSKVAGGRLYLLVTGNLKADETKLHLFFDTGTPGQNRLLPTQQFGVPVNITTDSGFWNWPNSTPNYDGLGRMGPDMWDFVPTPGNPLGTPLNGLRFDTGFNASYYLMVTNARWAPTDVQAWAAVLRPGGRLEEVGLPGYSRDYIAFDGGPKATADPMTFSGPRADAFDIFAPDIYCNYGPRSTEAALVGPPPVGPNTEGLDGLIRIAIDNSNEAGNTATTASAAAAGAVTTGVEISISISELGWNGTSPLRLAGFLASHDYEHASNQILGGVPWTTGSPIENLGNIRLLDFTLIPGQQFVNLNPGPQPCGPADVAGLGGVAGFDGQITVDDLVYFVGRFFAADVSVADLCGLGATGIPDGAVTVDDLVFFIAQFFSPCSP